MLLDVVIRLMLLLSRANAVAPYDALPADQALLHGLAMVAASSPDVSEQELARIAHHESGFWTDARPRMRHWPHEASKFPRRRHYVCGLLQVSTRSAAECVRWQNDIFAAYRAGADAMRSWHRSCRGLGRRGKARYRCARAGYAHGNDAARLAS